MADYPSNMREFDDTDKARELVYSGALDAVSKRFPVEDDEYRIELHKPRYTGPQDFSLDQQKQALMKERRLNTPITGNWRLIHKPTNTVLDEREDVVMHVPYYTPRGTIIHGGNEYSVVSQSRLRPGVYVRRQRTGEVEGHLNVKSGTGKPFRIQLEPQTGLFKVNVGQSSIPLYPMLKAMGITDQQLMKAWGPDLLAVNIGKQDVRSLPKLYQRFAGYRADPAADEAMQTRYLRDSLPLFEMDPEVNARTLGLTDAKGVTPEVLLRTTSKMLGVSRGEEQPDDRDSPRFSHIYSIEDLVRERIDKDAGRLTQNLLRRVRRSRNLQPIHRGALNAYLDSLLLGSGLAMPLEETNPLHTLEQLNRITKLGEGGIGSAEAITDEARDVNPGQFGFVDPITGPEGLNIGIDVRTAYRTFKGTDQNMYAEFKDARTGKLAYLRPDEAVDRVVAFPGQDFKGTTVYAMKQGSVQRVKPDDVDYVVPSFGHMMSSHTNLNPMPTAVQAGRQFYGAKFWSQYMPQVEGEVPLVDSLMPDGKSTFTEYYGRKVGTLQSKVAGTVTRVTDKGITVTDDNGKKHTYETVKDFPFNRLTGISYFPTVKAGDKVNVGDMVAHSNFTDAKTGAVNMGRNLKTAIIPFRGQSYEDAYVISESASKKLATERLYGFDADARHGIELGRGRFISAFPKTYTTDQIDKLDDSGVVKPGAVLNKGDPIILAVGPKLLTSADAQLGKLHKVLRGAFTDKSTVWEYSWPGTVTDVAMTRNGARVNVKSTPPVSEGDKLCYDPETEVLTQTGWKLFRDLTTMDCVAALNPETGHFEYLSPTAVQKYVHVGRMYQLQSQQLDLLVTDNHNLFVKTRTGTSFQLLTPDKVFGKRVSHKKDGIWVGCDQSSVHIPGVPRGHRWGPIDQPDLELPTDTFLMLLGMFLSEGNCIDNVRSSSYGIEFTQRKGISCSQMLEALEAAGFKNTYQEKSGKFRIYDKRLLTYFKQFGHAHDKFIPDWVFMLPPARLRILFRWLMWGDGHSEDGKPINYTTVSPRLADDVQRLCLHIGYAANVAIKPVSKNRIFIQEREIIARYTCYSVRIVTTKLTPTVNHGHVKQQKIQCEKWVQYTGDVYCCTLPKWHVLYVRRNGKPVWCGNSTRLGLKGVVGSIVPDDKMPRDVATNQPYELLMNPMAVLSRVAPNQIMEMALGKLARVTGKQVRLPQEPPPEGWAAWVTKQLADAGVTDSNDLFDPDSGKTLRNIGDGSVYVSAFHHLAEKKLSSRGDIGGYTSDEQPARGGNTGSKKWSQMDVNAALAHGATDVIKDVITIRGTKNEDFWKALKLGRPIPEPKVPFIYDKFLNTLRAGGINVTEKGDITSLLPMTDDDVSVLSKGAVDSSDMVDSEFEPMPGGLFDVGRTGGMAGNRWTHIDLPEPVPNPVMEEPVRRLLGLKIQQMEDILAGREKLNGLTGGPAIKAAMDKIDIDSMIAEHKQKVRTLRGANRDNSIKILGYLSSAKQQGVHPSKWMVTKIPVLPPVFRPVSRMGDVALMADLNELYRDVIETSKSFKELKGDLPEGELADERLNIYKSVKAAYGLGESITPEGQSKRLKGAIRQVIGSSPKYGLFQSKVISKPVDVVGRGVVTPDPNLDMDQLGIPADSAWTLYKDFVMRALVHHGYPAIRAAEMIDKRVPEAKEMLDKEMARRPVIMDRAPTWHKFNLLAFYPHIVHGHTIRVSPLVTKGFNMDFDGDQANFHVPVSDKAVEQTKSKMLPSANLFSLTDLQSVRHSPSMEMTFGLFQLTRPPNLRKPVTRFKTKKEAEEAYREGRIAANDPIEVLDM